MREIKLLTLFVVTLFLGIVSAHDAHAQNQIRVNGKTISATDKTPLSGVAVSVDDIFKCYTDIDGNFSLVMPYDAKLWLCHPDCEDATISVDGRQELTITLYERTIKIEEVMVTTTVKRKAVSVEPTEMEVKGGYLHINTRYRVPTWIFKTDCRFVTQPIIEDRTKGIIRAMRPVVIDGERYSQIQKRWLNFGDTADSLAPYVVRNNITKDEDIYSYRDSVYVGTSDPDYKNEYLTNCYLAIVSYSEPPLFLDTLTIARGVVNPIRHFEYDIPPMQLDGSFVAKGEEPYLAPTGADTTHIPAYEMKLQQLSGVAKIDFAVNSSKINYNDQESRRTIEDIQHFLENLQQNPDATIKSVSLCGYSSPEGGYNANLSLAKRRTQEMQRVILSTIDASMLNYVEMKIDSRVEQWSMVADIAEAEHPELTEKLRKIIVETKGDFDATYWRVRRLPEYRKEILPLLDELRTVTYSVDYSIYMPLPYESIRTMYDNGEKLTRYEYYTLITEEEDKSLLPEMEAAALRDFPNFTIVANRMAIKLINSDSANVKILEPMIGKQTPTPIKYNQTIMAIKADSLLLADSLASTLKGVEGTEYLQTITKILNGNVEEAYPYFEQEESLNKVLLLLAMKRDREAAWIMQRLMNDVHNKQNAKYCYISAICANRIEDLNEAMIYLQEAIAYDPSYEDLVKTDADLLDIYELLYGE